MAAFPGGGKCRCAFLFCPFWRLCCTRSSAGTYFILWNLEHWLQYRVSKLVDRLPMSVMIGNEQGIRAYRAHDQRGNRHFAPPCTNCYPVAIADTQPGRHLLVDFHPGVGCHLFQKWRAPRLVAREVVVDDTPGRQYQWILFIWLFCRWDVFNRVETCLAIGEAKTLLVETRRTRMIFRRAGPEDAILLGNLLVGNTPVVRFRSPGAEPQFIEYLARGLEFEVFALAQAPCQVADDLPVNPGLARGINRLVYLITRPSGLVTVPSSSPQTHPYQSYQ